MDPIVWWCLLAAITAGWTLEWFVSTTGENNGGKRK